MDTIKKEIEKQKLIAEFGYMANGFKNYSCLLILDGIEKEITFRIPIQECAETLTDKIEASLLIHWITI